MRSTLSLGIPLTVAWAAGELASGLMATIGAFTAVYASDRPYANRAIVLGVIALAFALAACLGVWTQHRYAMTIPVVAVVAMAGTFFCHALRIGPPGAYMFALACAVGTAIPTSHLPIRHVALLVLAGGATAWGIHMSGALLRPRGPEQAAVAAAAKAVARFAEAASSTERETACHGAARALHNGWVALVSRQPTVFQADDVLTRLRALNRELHLLFASCVHARDQPHGELKAIAGRADKIAEEAMHSVGKAGGQGASALPLGHLGVWRTIGDSLRFGSPALIATARVGIAVVIAGSIGTALGLDRAYWAMAAAVLVLHEGTAWGRVLQLGVERTVGTLAGLALAGAILFVQPGGWWLIAMLMLLQFVIDIMVPRNYALAAIFITAIALTVATGGHEVDDLGRLLWARAEETAIGCLTGLVVYAATARRSPETSIRRELAHAIGHIRKVLDGLANDEVTTPAALRLRRDLQHGLLGVMAQFETHMGGIKGRRIVAARLWPTVVAVQRLGYKLLATSWSLEVAGLEGTGTKARGPCTPSDFAEIDIALAKIQDALQTGVGPPTLPRLPVFLQGEITALNSSLDHLTT